MFWTRFQFKLTQNDRAIHATMRYHNFCRLLSHDVMSTEVDSEVETYVQSLLHTAIRDRTSNGFPGRHIQVIQYEIRQNLVCLVEERDLARSNQN